VRKRRKIKPKLYTQNSFSLRIMTCSSVAYQLAMRRHVTTQSRDFIRYSASPVKLLDASTLPPCNRHSTHILTSFHGSSHQLNHFVQHCSQRHGVSLHLPTPPMSFTNSFTIRVTFPIRFITALHAMTILPVCLSVKRVICDKIEERSSRFLYHRKDHLA